MTYAGDLTPTEAHSMLMDRADAVMVDVRSQAEWVFVGRPDIADRVRFVEWTQWPTGSRNPNFVADAAEGVDLDAPVILLCRSGVRSVAAAHELTAAGYTQVFNVLEGFEGDIDGNGHRSTGWRGADLPWTQR